MLASSPAARAPSRRTAPKSPRTIRPVRTPRRRCGAPGARSAGGVITQPDAVDRIADDRLGNYAESTHARIAGVPRAWLEARRRSWQARRKGEEALVRHRRYSGHRQHHAAPGPPRPGDRPGIARPDLRPLPR